MSRKIIKGTAFGGIAGIIYIIKGHGMKIYF